MRMLTSLPHPRQVTQFLDFAVFAGGVFCVVQTDFQGCAFSEANKTDMAAGPPLVCQHCQARPKAQRHQLRRGTMPSDAQSCACKPKQNLPPCRSLRLKEGTALKVCMHKTHAACEKQQKK
eukprot:TRINITY_DN4933_c0_g2_i1.p2 TRINITY_DN4933_c0_g2~~TRINITY_DN4933_c0_g2_i1.p2  ORF type:complete len:121 (+),score=7.02 TRINITY_DN4933_c0_g2_i1:695-1057(+)